ncbi:hypothetical protein Clacol_001079 [Clathrus columnatus]|uniref:Jacalin-type lectin domain-containing protein n=1 Tax=Clathrus columnatus TaxID=1419009 RepID=A0AAV5A2M3_9AGAM|nr:hypothetical protein Clacol_001079 [Clathrus columnatus]
MSAAIFLPTSQKGGSGGTAFDELADYPQIVNYRLVNINYWTNNTILRGIQLEWESPHGEIFTGNTHGTSTGTFGSLTLNRRERIITMTGRASDRVNALTLITNQGNSVNFGGNGGTPFQWVISFTDYPNVAFHHFTGKSGLDVDALEAIFVAENPVN